MLMAPTNDHVPTATRIEREIQIDAKPETVFALLTESEESIRWMGVEATLEPHAGGLYRVKCNGKDIARGEFLEVVPHSRVVFSWGWEGEGHPIPPGSTTVEITLTPEGGGTRLNFLHRDLPAAAMGDYAHGWDHFLDRLQVLAAGGDPGDDAWMTDGHAEEK
jgi:uncharacterized protein YndB with AHSA1/START domain